MKIKYHSDTFLKNRWAILYYLAIGGLCLILVFRILPDTLSVIRKYSALSDHEALIQEAVSIEQHMDQYETEKEKLDDQLEHMVLSQDREAQLSTILNKVSHVAGETRALIQRIKADEVIQMESHSELPIEIVIQSEFHPLGRFLNRLETGQPVIKVQSVDMQSESMVSQTLHSRIRVVVLYLERSS